MSMEEKIGVKRYKSSQREPEAKPQVVKTETATLRRPRFKSCHSELRSGSPVAKIDAPMPLWIRAKVDRDMSDGERQEAEERTKMDLGAFRGLLMIDVKLAQE